MKGCARQCGVYVLVYLALAGGLFFFFQSRYGLKPEETLGAVLAAAFFGWLGLSFLFGIAQPVRERAALRGAMTGERPADGRHAAVAGTISSVERLRAPLSGAECVAYRYEIYRMVRSGKSSHKAVYYRGIALIPSVINTRSGAVRLLAVPDFDFPAAQFDSVTAVRNAREHIASTEFEQKKAAFTRPRIEEQWTDDDGAYRRDEKLAEEDVDLELCTLEEHHVKRGETVCAIGLFSAQRAGLIPDPNWAKPARIMKGDVETISAKLSRRILNYAIAGVIFPAIAAAIVVLFLRR